MTEICALASGSNGNCYYIGNENEAVLIDVGIFYKRLVERMNESGLDIAKLKAAFISHEHTDHVQGARVTSKKTGIPIYYSKKTYYKCYDKNKASNIVFFENGKQYQIGGFTIIPFAKKHDAVDPSSFIVETNNKTIGIMTDIGEVDETLIDEFSKCDAVFLESNYDPEMLLNGPYPYFLKQRVESTKGHLSNEQTFELIQNHASVNLKTIFLSHISAVNNSGELVTGMFSELNRNYNIILTSRYKASEIIHL